VLKDLMTEPLGVGKDGKAVWIGDVWPTSAGVQALMKYATNSKVFRRAVRRFRQRQPAVERHHLGDGQVYNWPKSTYIAEPPFFEHFGMQPGSDEQFVGARRSGSSATR
jgi:aconitate hydratase